MTMVLISHKRFLYFIFTDNILEYNKPFLILSEKATKDAYPVGLFV
jgi:hypothetical protein